jgi:hypothetical protein
VKAIYTRPSIASIGGGRWREAGRLAIGAIDALDTAAVAFDVRPLGTALCYVEKAPRGGAFLWRLNERFKLFQVVGGHRLAALHTRGPVRIGD